MNFLSKCLIIIFFIVIADQSVAQNGGYIVQHPSVSVGLNFSSHYNVEKNYMLLQFKKYEKAFSPDTINEIGHTNSDGSYIDRYVSHYLPEDRTTKVFLKQIVFGESISAGIYEYRTKNGKRLFYERDSIIFEIPSDKIALRDTLKELTSDNDFVQDAIPYLSTSGTSLRKFYSVYESGKQRHYPLSTWGIQVGGIASFISGIEAVNGLLPNPSADYNFSIGAFVDIPILYSNFYIHPEIYYSQSAFSSSLIFPNSSLNFVSKYKSITVPIMFRYVSPSYHWRPYGEFGLFVFSIFDEMGNTYQTSWNNASSNVYIESTNTNDVIDKIQYGVSAGIGCLYQLNYKNAISLGCRYNGSFFAKNIGVSTFTVNLAYHF